MNTENVYVGRFAPSPTGPLHFGSLVAALASYLDARHNNGRWLVRIEDLDPPRESKAAPGIILGQLKRFGLVWDGDVIFQSSRLPAYSEALDQLRDMELLFPCVCSRKQTPPVYDGRCRHLSFEETRDYAVRLRVIDDTVHWRDRIAGDQRWHLGKDVGDFIIKRRDGLFAYHLAVVVDDGFQGITHVVRGNDLLDSTPKHIYLQHCLGLTVPDWCHFPVVTGRDGKKLSKQSHAMAVDTDHPLPQLKQALSVLSQPVAEPASSVDELLGAAIRNWDITRIQHQQGVPAP